jgi:hypothetical protein
MSCKNYFLNEPPSRQGRQEKRKEKRENFTNDLGLLYFSFCFVQPSPFFMIASRL